MRGLEPLAATISLFSLWNMENAPTNFMREALLEGRKALPSCRPNPPVGCVLVLNGEIVSRGHTQSPGGFHAEAMALADFHGETELLTAYVTLEPCSFQGRTPSCAKALVKSGVRKVVVALIDPDPRNRGAGINILREAGVSVEVGLLEAEAENDLSSYRWRDEI
jgi:pyrimidine deaminase RibD-like protein